MTNNLDVHVLNQVAKIYIPKLVAVSLLRILDQPNAHPTIHTQCGTN